MKNNSTINNFSSDFFSNNRNELRKRAKTLPILISANGLLQKSHDSTFPFRQDSNFWYLTGIDLPDMLLLMTDEEDLLVLPSQSDYRDIFDGEIDPNSLTKKSGIKAVMEFGAGWRYIRKLLQDSRGYSVIFPPKSIYQKSHGFYHNPAKMELNKKLKRVTKKPANDIRLELARMRMIKKPEELIAIKSAIKITEDAFSFIANNLNDFKSEKDIESSMTSIFSKAGVDHAYEPIVAMGINACTLHYIANSSNIIQNSPVLIDVGAQAGYYASDISRTYWVGDQVSNRYKDIYSAVKSVQEFAISKIKSGISIKDYEKDVENFMGQKLKDLGLTTSIDNKSVRKYYPHATSHHLGLDVHDVADYQTPIPAGSVLTVEPGIYIPEEGIGIRIEDDVLVTKNGVEILSQHLPS